MTTAPTIPQHTARHVLWFYGQDGGIQPGTFTEHLITAIDSADLENAGLLANAYPSLVAAVIAAKCDPDGIAALQRIAGAIACARCGDTDGPFGAAGGEAVCEDCLPTDSSDDTFTVYISGETLPGTEIGLTYIYVTTPRGKVRMTSEEADALGRKLLAAAQCDRDSEAAEAEAVDTDVPDDRCSTCGCIDPDCTSCTSGNCRDDSDEWVHCAASHCPNGERHAKATERGWTNDHGTTWLCPSHPLGGAA